MALPTRVLRRLQGEDWAKGIEFMKSRAYAAYQCDPPAPPQALFGVFMEGENIVGVVGVDCAENGKVPLLNRWDLTGVDLPIDFNPNSIAAFGWWFAAERGISESLVLIATNFAQSQAKTQCLCELKPSAAAHLRKLGCVLVQFFGARLLLASIASEKQGYYLQLPLPGLHSIELQQMKQAMERRLDPDVPSLRFNFRFE